MDDIAVTLEIPAGWLEALARSDAQLEAGQLVSGDDVMLQAQEAIDRLKVRQRDKVRAP